MSGGPGGPTDDSLAAWPPSWGTPPPYSPPPACPANPHDYSIAFGTYGGKLFWRGLIPFAGFGLQKSIKPPPTCYKDNLLLRSTLQGSVSDWAQLETSQTLSVWTSMNQMLSKLSTIGSVTARLIAEPLSNQLFYLYAGVVAVTFLAAAVLIGL